MLLYTRNTRTTRVPLYTYATQRPIGTRARSLHVGTPAHVYTLPTAGSPTYARIGRYAIVPARWLHVGTPAHVYTVYGRPVLNLGARAGRYTTRRVTNTSSSGGTSRGMPMTENERKHSNSGLIFPVIRESFCPFDLRKSAKRGI